MNTLALSFLVLGSFLILADLFLTYLKWRATIASSALWTELMNNSATAYASFSKEMNEISNKQALAEKLLRAIETGASLEEVKELGRQLRLQMGDCSDDHLRQLESNRHDFNRPRD